MKRIKGLFPAVGIFCLAWLLPCHARADAPEKKLLGLSLDELMEVEVTSVSKKPQRLANSAAAVFVIGEEDIRRSGANNIPDLLRMVPGLQVAQSNGHDWSISARGFNNKFANKLLVLIDGRSVYTPVFAGVFWNAQDTLLEDIERIEVIRGPGATLWGANAVNGIINIITKKSSDTLGGIASGGGGNEETAFAGMRYGTELSENTNARIYTKAFTRDDSKDIDRPVNAEDSRDYWEAVQGGFRLDSTHGSDEVTLQGDIYAGNEGYTALAPTVVPPHVEEQSGSTDYSGGNVLGRWTGDFDDAGEVSVQSYYDRANRVDGVASLKVDTFDLDFQHRIDPLPGQEFTWGLGYRFISDDLHGRVDTAEIEPSSRDFNLASGFIQDEISLIEEVLTFTVGSKFEHNDQTEWEVQPSARAIWRINENQSVWAAFSRAVRTPSRAEDDSRLTVQAIPAMPPGAAGPGSPPAKGVFIGDHDFDSETLNAYELGFRTHPIDQVSFDIATFFNHYDDLRSSDPAGMPIFSPEPIPHATVLLPADNALGADSYGVEALMDVQAMPWWRLQAGYTFMKVDIRGGMESGLPPESAIGDSPESTATLRSLINLPYDLQFDSMFRFVDSYSGIDVDSYTELDVRIGWSASENLDISLIGRNLLDSSHQEFETNYPGSLSTEIERSLFLKVTHEF